jgi:hypothetical protein
MATRDNTKLIQAHIPEELKKAFDKKLIDDDKTQQQVLTDLVTKYVEGK